MAEMLHYWPQVVPAEERCQSALEGTAELMTVSRQTTKYSRLELVTGQWVENLSPGGSQYFFPPQVHIIQDYFSFHLCPIAIPSPRHSLPPLLPYPRFMSK